MPALTRTLAFLLKSVVVGLAAAFLILLLRPELGHDLVEGAPPVERELRHGATAKRTGVVHRHVETTAVIDHRGGSDGDARDAAVERDLGVSLWGRCSD